MKRPPFIVRAGGGMGLNTISPSASMLEVRTTNLTGAAIRFGFHTGGAGHLIGGPSRVAIATDDVVERISISHGNGNVGIGTLPSGTYKLEVNGSAHRVDNASTRTVASDARLKKNIHAISGALDKLLALRGVTFEYTSGDTNPAVAGERLGFIAQQVEQVFPDWVGSDTEGYKNVTTRGVEALLVEALRDLRAEKDARIAELQKQNESLEKPLQRLERLVTKSE